MMIHEITAKAGRHRRRKRIGRGRSSGSGKTAGRGHKGYGSRAGSSIKLAFEGGQMPYFRRLPKRGFTNVNFKTHFWIVNLGAIVAHPDFQSGGEVTTERLIQAGLVRDTSRPVKVLGDMRAAGGGESPGVALNVAVDRVTDRARRMIESAGGSVNELGSRKDRVRGVDRNSADRTPTRQTKRRPKKKRQPTSGAKGGSKKNKKG